MRWPFDTREPIRSSPAVDGNDHVVLRLGEGRPALRAQPRREPALSAFGSSADDRNDLNASPALGLRCRLRRRRKRRHLQRSYDYLPARRGPRRCALLDGHPRKICRAMVRSSTSPRHSDRCSTTPPSSIRCVNQPLAFSLFVRAHARHRPGRSSTKPPSRSRSIPRAPVETTVSRAIAAFLMLVPKPSFSGDATSITIAGDYLVEPTRVGLQFSGERRGGYFEGKFHF